MDEQRIREIVREELAKEKEAFAAATADKLANALSSTITATLSIHDRPQQSSKSKRY
jgi:hypothetical protein